MKPSKHMLFATPFLVATLHMDAIGSTQALPDRGLPDAESWLASPQDMAIVQLSAAELARRIQSRALGSEQVVRAFIGHIARQNAKYNAIVLLDWSAALERAQAADEALARGEVWGPLHGVPVTIKDTYAISGLRTTAGDPDLMGYVPQEDAAIVSLLRRAGAIVLAKTNAATLAMDMQTNNAIFGRTPNPWDTKLTVGGSSGGCAAAVATHMSALSFGSDLAGSIRLPAAYAGIWGLRPTHGVVSMQGHIPPKPDEVNGIRTMAVAGPLANSVEDLQLALSVLAQTSTQDQTVAPLKPRQAPPASIKDLKFAYMDELGGIPVSREIKDALQRVVDQLRAAGATVVRAEPRDFSYQRTWETWGALVGMQGGYERSNLVRWFGRLFAYQSVADIPHQRRILDPISVEGYMRALTEKEAQTNALEHFLSGYDGWIVPVASLPPFEHHTPSRTFGIFNVYDKPLQVDGHDLAYYNVTQSYTTLFSVTEGPVISMPAGQTGNGLPVGFQLVGRRFEDWRLLDVARLLEPELSKLRAAHAPADSPIPIGARYP